MLCLSVVVGRLLAVRLAERAGMDAKLMDRCCVWTLAAALIGARLLYVVTNLDQFDELINVFRVWDGGVVAYGGFIGGFLGSAVFCRVYRIRVLDWADCVVPSLCIGLIFTRIGCFLAGCDFGRPWTGAWAVQFPAGSPAFNQQTLQGLLPAGATQSLSVHPTQLYESLAGLVLLVAVMAARRRQTFSGQPLMTFVLGYAVLRYAIEIVRADANRGAIGPFSTSQLIAMATFVLAAAFWYAKWRGHAPFHRSGPELTI